MCVFILELFVGSSAKLSSAGLVQAEMPVGTPEYLAPEVLLAIETTDGKVKSRPGTSRSPKSQPLPSYGAECDYWSLGIVAYEIIFGKTPFRSDQLATTYQNIQLHKKHLKYPECVEVSNGEYLCKVFFYFTQTWCRVFGVALNCVNFSL